MQHDPQTRMAAPDPLHDDIQATCAESMRGTNGYWRQLTTEELSRNEHRTVVGGMWDELGPLQLEFMREHGLQPQHDFLDVGCGALRGGLHFVRFLDPGRYYGIDINASLLEGGRIELERAGLLDRAPHLICDEAFALDRFGIRFDAMLAVSLFTHLHMEQIRRCLCAVTPTLNENGVFYATYFPAPKRAWSAPLPHADGAVITQLDSDPFHQHEDEYRDLATAAGLTLEIIGDWGHPRGQHMLAFRHSGR